MHTVQSFVDNGALLPNFGEAKIIFCPKVKHISAQFQGMIKCIIFSSRVEYILYHISAQCWGGRGAIKVHYICPTYFYPIFLRGRKAPKNCVCCEIKIIWYKEKFNFAFKQS